MERHIVEQLEAAGWRVGKSADQTRKGAISRGAGLVEDSQPQAWLRSCLRRMASELVMWCWIASVKQLENKVDGGTVNVLRYGFAVAGGGTLAMSQALPEDERNDTVIARYGPTACVAPQLRYSLDKADEIDLAFFINGIPVATVELKTDFTQSVQAAMQQYRMDRRPERKSGGWSRC